MADTGECSHCVHQKAIVAAQRVLIDNLNEVMVGEHERSAVHRATMLKLSTMYSQARDELMVSSDRVFDLHHRLREQETLNKHMAYQRQFDNQKIGTLIEQIYQLQANNASLGFELAVKRDDEF